MKKTTLIKSTKIFVVFLTLLFSLQIHSQCINTNPFVDVMAENSGTPQEIAWCYQANNYITISGLITGGDYIFTVSGNNGPGYVTITSTTNDVIAQGSSPLTVNNLSATVVRFHVADNAQCITSNCYTSTLQYLPACPQPINLSCTGITTTGALASWTAGGTETLWDLEYGMQGFAQGAGTLISNLTTTNYTFTTLSPGTAYEFYVKAKCTVDEQSFLTGPFKFTTFCNTVTEIYENFDGTASNLGLLPNCWLRSTDFSANVSVVNGSTSPASAPNNLRLFSFNGDSYALLPPVSNLNAGTHRLRFKAFSNIENTLLNVGYLTNPNDVNSFVLLTTITLPFGDSSQAQPYTILPGAALPAGVTVLAFKYTPTNGFFSGAANIDDLRWEPNSTCLEPVFASAINILDTSAELIWNAGGTELQWEIQYGPQNFTLGQGTTVSNLTTASFNLINLTPNTNYQYYVRAICAGNGTSGWSDPYTFKTDCTSVTSFIENFDTTNAWLGLVPDCWIKAGNSFFNEVISGSTISEPNYLNLNGEDPISTAFAIMPSVSNLNLGTHRLKFTANSSNPEAVLEVGYISNVNDVTTYSFLAEFQVGTDTNGNNADFIVLPPTTIPSGVKNLVFKNSGIPGASTNFYIDDVKWEVIPACQEPTELALVAVASTSATLGWVTNGTASQWEIQYGVPGFTLGQGTIVTASVNPYVLNGLTSNTNYEFYVRSICSTTSNSSWTGPFEFRTLCDDVTEFYENFDTTEAWQGLIPFCWSRGSNNIFSNAVTGNSEMSAPNCLNMDAYAGFSELYTVMPSVSNLQANTHRLRFKVQGNGFDSGALAVGYMTNLNEISTFVSLQEFQIPANTTILDFFYTPTTVPAGIKNLVFKNSGSITGPLNVKIDDVKWELLPTVAPVCTTGLLAVTDPDCGTAPVLLSWNPAPNADAYRVTIGTTPGGSDILNNVDVGSNPSYIFNSPIAATTYYWTVIPYNPLGFPTTCPSSSFLTPNGLCYCIPEYSTGKTAGDLISNIEIAGTTLANNSGTAPVNPAYTLFTGQPNYTATLQAGQNYSMTVSVGTFGNQQVAVWIDSNNNGSYESSERIGFSTGPISSSNPGTFTLSIPCAVNAGFYRLRVRDVWSLPADLIDPCLEYGYGETEDYYVTISSATLPATPTGDAIQTINVSAANEATIEDLVVTGTNVQWFATQADALTGTNPLAIDTVITNGSVYYAVSVEGSCLSTPLAVTVTVTLGVNDFDSASFKYYPNPVTDRLSIAYSDTISEVIVYNLLGQQIIVNRPNATQTQVDLSQLNAGTYVVKVTSNNLVKTVKVIKQ